MTKYGNFNESITKLLTERLSSFKDKSLTRDVCISIYSTIFQTMQDVFSSSGVEISNESMNWLSQEYYDSVSINNNQELDPNIFTQRASLESVNTKELGLLAMMLRGTPYAVPVISVIRKRS